MREARPRRSARLAFLCCLCLWMVPAFAVSHQQRLPLALTTDPPPDRAYPAAMDTMRIPSHGAELNALMYVASGAGPHPVVILLNGFPGNEKNLDLAQAIRRDGWNVLVFSYRGSGGSSGQFSLPHCTQDTAAVIAFLHDRGYAAELRSDPRRIVLIGHSTGGYVATYAGAHDTSVIGVATISAAHLAALGNLDRYAARLASRPVLLVTSNDGLAPQALAFGNALQHDGSTTLTEKHFASDHSYSAARVGLTIAVLDWLDTLPGKP
jgi:uncharacterized protein